MPDLPASAGNIGDIPPGADGGIGGAPGGSAAPNSSPMATPGTKFGSKEHAMVNLGMAADIIEQSLHSLGSETPEGKQAMAALKALGGIIGPRTPQSQGLQPAQIQQLMAALPKGLRPGGAPGGAGAPGAMPPGGGMPPGGAMPPQGGMPPPGGQPPMMM